MPTGERKKDPYLSFRFLVEIQGLVVAGFSEASGLTAETEIDEQPEGGVNEFVHKFPKRTKYPQLTLKRGLTDSDELWKWHRDVIWGKVKRRTIHLVLLNSEGNEKRRWSFADAYPIKWMGPDFKSDGGAVAIESLEIAHHGFER